MTGVWSLLHLPRRLAEELIRLQVQQLTTRSICEKTTPQYGGIGGGSSGGGGAKDSSYADLADINDEVEAKQKEFERSRTELVEFLAELEASHPRAAALLRCRYLWWFEWSAVKEWMGNHGYRCTSLRTIYNWHNAALSDAEYQWRLTHDTRQDLHAAE